MRQKAIVDSLDKAAGARARCAHARMRKAVVSRWTQSCAIPDETVPNGDFEGCKHTSNSFSSSSSLSCNSGSNCAAMTGENNDGNYAQWKRRMQQRQDKKEGERIGSRMQNGPRPPGLRGLWREIERRGGVGGSVRKEFKEGRSQAVDVSDSVSGWIPSSSLAQVLSRVSCLGDGSSNSVAVVLASSKKSLVT